MVTPISLCFLTIKKTVSLFAQRNKNTFNRRIMYNSSSNSATDDFTYSNGLYTYHDTYVGGEQFAGEEAVWLDGKAQYAMNYFLELFLAVC